jgi:hypothetical protein
MFSHFLQICLQDFNKCTVQYTVYSTVYSICLLTYRVERRRPTEVKDFPRGYIYPPTLHWIPTKVQQPG